MLWRSQGRGFCVGLLVKATLARLPYVTGLLAQPSCQRLNSCAVPRSSFIHSLHDIPAILPSTPRTMTYDERRSHGGDDAPPPQPPSYNEAATGQASNASSSSAQQQGAAGSEQALEQPQTKPEWSSYAGSYRPGEAQSLSQPAYVHVHLLTSSGLIYLQDR